MSYILNIYFNFQDPFFGTSRCRKKKTSQIETAPRAAPSIVAHAEVVAQLMSHRGRAVGRQAGAAHVDGTSGSHGDPVEPVM